MRYSSLTFIPISSLQSRAQARPVSGVFSHLENSWLPFHLSIPESNILLVYNLWRWLTRDMKPNIIDGRFMASLMEGLATQSHMRTLTKLSENMERGLYSLLFFHRKGQARRVKWFVIGKCKHSQPCGLWAVERSASWSLSTRLGCVGSGVNHFCMSSQEWLLFKWTL